MANEKEYKGLNNTYHTNDETYIDFSNRKKTRWLKRFFPNFVKDNLKPLSSPPIATFNGENYYHKVEGSIASNEDLELNEEEKAFNAITDSNPIMKNDKRIFVIDRASISSGGTYIGIVRIEANVGDIYAYTDLAKSALVATNEAYKGKLPSFGEFYPNDVFARFYNVPSEDSKSYVLYYALVGED